MDEVILHAAGDIMIDRPQPETLFEHVAGTLKQGDVNFCQLEMMFSERGSRNPTARAAIRANPKNATAMKWAGFNIVSMSGNHCMDFCEEGFYDTVQVLEENDLKVLGVGNNIQEARKPIIMEQKGVRIGFLAYNSILPKGYEARIDKPGCCPLRAYTVYEPVEYDQPGQPCRIHSFTDRDDLETMVQDIKNLKPLVDVVAVSLHFGLHFVRAKLADYQREASHAAIDAGADVIIGTHAHILKGIEVYKGKVIFYSLCNFAADRRRTKENLNSPAIKELTELYGFSIDEDWLNSYAFPTDSRKTILAKCTIIDKKIQKVSFLPVMINRQAQPEIVPAKSKEFGEVLQYMKDISLDQGLKTTFKTEGDEVTIVT